MRKNNKERKGHQMSLGVSTDPDRPYLHLPFQLGLLMDLDLAGTRPRTNCNGHCGKRCTVCPPLIHVVQRDP
jgi:hypothetical protein